MMDSASQKNQRIFWIVLAGWTALNFIQSYFTELFHDEAYYWLYSIKLSLGYFDHAPGIGVVIRAGTELFGGELGVRFFIVLMNSATLLLLWKLVQPASAGVFFSIAFGMLLMHLGGFFAAPDSPAAFALALTLLAMKRFYEKPVLISGIWLGLAVALVCWSKYQAVVMVLLLALASFRLWRKPAFWLAVLTAAALYLPHVLWVIHHKLSMFSFYLSERGSQSGIGSRYLGDLLAGAAVMLGPLMTPLLVWALWKHTATDGFIRALRFASAGFILFLIVLSLVSPTEANWIAPASLPLLVIAIRYFSNKPAFHKWLYVTGGISFMLILTFRTYLAWDFAPAFKNPRNETHGWKEWAMQVDSAAAGYPVVFINSYQHASKYWFYTKHAPVAVSTFTYRKSQMDLMGTEASVQGKKVLLAAGWDHTLHSDTIRSRNGVSLWVHYIDNFRSYPDERIEMLTPLSEMEAGKSYGVELRLWKPHATGKLKESFELKSPSGKSFHIGYAFRRLNGTPEKSDTCAGNLEGLRVQDEWKTTVSITAPEKPGDYGLYFFLQPDHLVVSENSGRRDVVVRR